MSCGRTRINGCRVDSETGPGIVRIDDVSVPWNDRRCNGEGTEESSREKNEDAGEGGGGGHGDGIVWGDAVAYRNVLGNSLSSIVCSIVVLTSISRVRRRFLRLNVGEKVVELVRFCECCQKSYRR